jgi:hypothetical protein
MLNRFIYALLVTLGLACFVSGQNPEKCQIKGDGNAAKYQPGHNLRTVEGSPSLLVHINVKRRAFNRKEIIYLAEQLNNEFCKERKLVALIFDSRAAALKFDPVTDLEVYSESIRGEYSLDRTTGQEYISFSPDPSKP